MKSSQHLCLTTVNHQWPPIPVLVIEQRSTTKRHQSQFLTIFSAIQPACMHSSKQTCRIASDFPQKSQFSWCLIKDVIGGISRVKRVALKFKYNMEVIRNMKQSDNAFLGLGVKFPALNNAPGVAPWNPNQLDIWAAESAADANAVHSARFLLNLWMPTREWQCGRFDVSEAIQSWDRTHRRAFLDWAASDTNAA